MFTIVGAVIMLLGFVVLIQRVKMVSESKVIKGTVVDLDQHFSPKGITFHPVIEYYNDETQTMERFTDGAGYCPPRHNIGDQIEFRYYKNKIGAQCISNIWFNIWGAPIVVIFMGGVFILFSLR